MKIRQMLAGAALLTSPVAGAQQSSAKLSNFVEFGGTATFSYSGTDCHDGVIRVVAASRAMRGRTVTGVSHAPSRPRTCLITRVHVKLDGGPVVHDFTSPGTRGILYSLVSHGGKLSVMQSG